MSRKMDHKIWENPPHLFGRQPGKKKDTDDYQFKSCLLGQKAGLLTSGRSYYRNPHFSTCGKWNSFYPGDKKAFYVIIQ